MFLTLRVQFFPFSQKTADFAAKKQKMEQKLGKANRPMVVFLNFSPGLV